MAWEAPGLDISLPTTTTGLKRYRFVNISTGGNVIYPVVNGQTIGVLQDGTTGTTRQPRACTVRVGGVSKVVTGATASTVGVGELVAASSIGVPKTMVAAAIAAGRVIAGSSGAANRVLTVLLSAPNASTATI